MSKLYSWLGSPLDHGTMESLLSFKVDKKQTEGYILATDGFD